MNARRVAVFGAVLTLGVMVRVSAAAGPLSGVSACSAPAPVEMTPSTSTRRCLAASSMRDAPRLCLQRLASSDTDRMQFELQSGSGATQAHWKGSEGPAFEDLDLIRVHWADVDADRRAEVLVAVPTTISNGLAIEHYDLWVATSSGQVIGPLETVDFGQISGLYRVPGREGCALLQSVWASGEEPGRPEGLYAYGRWRVLDARGGRWVPYTRLPNPRRRLLDSFAAERGQRGTIEWWFKNTRTQFGHPWPDGE